MVKRDLFQTRDLDALAMLDRADELAGFQKIVVRVCVEPSIAATHLSDERVAGSL